MRGRLWFRDRLYCMADFKDAAKLEVFRAMVRRRMEHFGLSTGDVAAEIGISPAGLRHVLLGAIPATRVRRALEEWSQDQRPQMAPTGAVVLSLAAEMFPMPERTEVRLDLAARLVASLKRQGQTVPGWLREAASRGRVEKPNAKVQPHAAPTQLGPRAIAWRRMSAATPR